MLDFKREFIDFVLDCEALKFGEFTLKSGRVSPYFFDAGSFSDGERIYKLALFYARAIRHFELKPEVLFGPSYKGIPLAASTSSALYQLYSTPVGFCYNRKETKTHGEGGDLVGARMTGKRVLLIDDVITGGTTVGEVVTLLERHQISITHAIVALDRQERGTEAKSAVEEVAARYHINIVSIISLVDLCDYLKEKGEGGMIAKMQAYQAKYATRDEGSCVLEG